MIESVGLKPNLWWWLLLLLMFGHLHVHGGGPFLAEGSLSALSVGLVIFSIKVNRRILRGLVVGDLSIHAGRPLLSERQHGIVFDAGREKKCEKAVQTTV
jgi:hypothetical protein